jgi:FkbM family methyltransferase
MLQTLKSVVKANPTLRRFALAVRMRFVPTATDEMKHFLLHIANTVKHPVFVKVGANDGITGDPTEDLLLKNPIWKGLLIEPVPYCVERLKQIYHDKSRFIVDPVAVSSTPGVATFYYVSEDAKAAIADLPEWYDQLGSFDRQHIVRKLNGALEPFIVTADVTVESLSHILQKHDLSNVDFLHIDTEGHDLEVLKSLDMSVHRPTAVFVEHKHLSRDDRAEMRAILEGNDYNILDCGSDFFAVQSQALTSRLAAREATN